MTSLVERLRETAALYLACMEDKDAHVSKILEGAATIEALCEALGFYMSQFGQALDAHNIPFGPTQIKAEARARELLEKAQS